MGFKGFLDEVAVEENQVDLTPAWRFWTRGSDGE